MTTLVADVMLSKLARWLRLSGTSVEDVRFSDDDRIIKYVKEKKAILLTADEALAQRSKKQGFKVLLVKEGSIEEQLAFVAKSLGLNISACPSSICTYCNAPLERIKKEDAVKYVPEHVAKRYRAFYKCPKCGRVYWHGTHWLAISKKLEKARKLESKI
ncbi:MAG: Mut7-C RNAse domain-containing protein [Candidatus Micrarchaeia archaeon]